MKKILLYSLGGLLALGVIGAIVGAFFLGSIVKAGVNGFGPQLTLTNVTLDGATISPLSGSGTLTGLKVANVAGWKNEQAFTLGKIHLDVAPFSIMGDHIVINEISIDAPEFDYETKLTDSNVAQLLANIQKFSGNSPTAKNGKPVKFEVKKFRLTHAKVSVGVAGMATVAVSMPDLSLDNVGSEQGGITPDQLVVVVMKTVTANIVTAGKDAVLNAGKAALGGIGNAASGATDGAKKAVDGIKGMFGGSKQ